MVWNRTLNLKIKKMMFSPSHLFWIFVFGLCMNSEGVVASGWEKINPGKGPSFISAHPIRETGTFKQRGTPQLTIQKTAQGKVVAIYLGYPIKETSLVVVKVDTGKKPERVEFYPVGEWAFVEDDHKVIAVMMRGTEMTVEGTSQKGTTSIDTYSLMGLTKALKDLG